MSKTIFIAIDGIADGAFEVNEKKNLLSEIKKKYPDAKRATPYEKGSNVIIVSTKDDGP